MPGIPKPIFEIYVEDDRYAVPTLHLVAAEDEADARRIVDRLIQENAHHLAAELYSEGHLLDGFGSFAGRPRPQARPADGALRLKMAGSTQP
jgi:hypothetical protein